MTYKEKIDNDINATNKTATMALVPFTIFIYLNFNNCAL